MAGVRTDGPFFVRPFFSEPSLSGLDPAAVTADGESSTTTSSSQTQPSQTTEQNDVDTSHGNEHQIPANQLEFQISTTTSNTTPTTTPSSVSGSTTTATTTGSSTLDSTATASTTSTPGSTTASTIASTTASTTGSTTEPITDSATGSATETAGSSTASSTDSTTGSLTGSFNAETTTSNTTGSTTAEATSLLELIDNQLYGPQYQALSAAQKDSIQQAERLIRQAAGESYTRLSNEQKLELLNFLIALDLSPDALMEASVQGAGGRGFAANAITGTGHRGHYVSSALNSLAELIRTQRLTPDTMRALTEMAKAPLQADLEPQRLGLVQSSLQNIAFPEKIDQHSKGTCAATVPEMQLALQDPARYVRMVTALASPDGKVPDALMPGGNLPVMEREPGTETDDKSGRSIASRLLQPAFMEYANDGANYDNARDRHDGPVNRGGLVDSEILRLTNGLFGAASHRMLQAVDEPSKARLLQEVETELQNGRPVHIGMHFPLGGGHVVMLTKMDEVNNQAYFLNPWGEMHTMPLDLFKLCMDSAFIPNNPPASSLPVSEDAAMQSLPGAASNPANYRPLSEAYGQLAERLLETVPELSQPLSEGQKESLLEILDDHDIPASQLDRLIQIARSGHLDQNLIDRLQSAETKDDVLKTIYLYERASLANLPEAEFQALVEAYPEKHLSTLEFDQLLDALSVGDSAKITELTAQARSQMTQSAMGREDVSSLTQEQIKERFSSLEDGWTSEASYQKLEQLAAVADASTKAWMIEQLMSGATTGRAERAIATIIGNAGREDQQAILAALNLRELGSEMENPDQAAGVLNTIVKAGFAPDLLERHLNDFFAGVSSQNVNLGFIYRDNRDSVAAAAFIRRLDDRSLASLPASVKSRLLDAVLREQSSLMGNHLGAGVQLGARDERAVFPRLIKVMSPAQLQSSLGRLADGYTNGNDERKMLTIMLQSSDDQFRTLMAQRGLMERLADELEPEDMARIAYRLASLGDHAGLNRLLDHMYSEENSTSDNLAARFVSLCSERALNNLPQSTLKKLHTALDEGWTTDFEERMMKRLEKSVHW